MGSDVLFYDETATHVNVILTSNIAFVIILSNFNLNIWLLASYTR